MSKMRVVAYKPILDDAYLNSHSFHTCKQPTVRVNTVVDNVEYGDLLCEV